MVAIRFCAVGGALVLAVSPALVHAASKEAQELLALRERRAPLECELTKLYREVGAAHQAGDDARVQALTARMHEVDDRLSVDRARVERLTRRVQGTPDHQLILKQQLRLDKACK